jgi:hypothetical protein
MSYSDVYGYVIGECGVKPSDYWKMTEAETMALIVGHQTLMCESAANIRNLYTLTYNMNAKKGRQKNAKQLWPLPIDFVEKRPIEERLKIYEKILKNSKN